VGAKPPTPECPVGPNGLKLDAATERKLKKMDEKAAAERAKHVAVHRYSSLAEEEDAAFTCGVMPPDSSPRLDLYLPAGPSHLLAALSRSRALCSPSGLTRTAPPPQ
jgi:hypothetical protein